MLGDDLLLVHGLAIRCVVKPAIRRGALDKIGTLDNV